MESFFKCYLKSKNIKFDKRFGREYFIFDGNRIDTTMNQFKNMFAENTTKKNNTLLNINTLSKITSPNCKPIVNKKFKNNSQIKFQTLEELIQYFTSKMSQ